MRWLSGIVCQQLSYVLKRPKFTLSCGEEGGQPVRIAKVVIEVVRGETEVDHIGDGAERVVDLGE